MIPKNSKKFRPNNWLITVRLIETILIILIILELQLNIRIICISCVKIIALKFCGFILNKGIILYSLLNRGHFY